MASSNGIKNLDLFSLPLTGRVLIEASAGTGKTYSLAFIYLRLLLGIGENGYKRPLTVNEILVVTFTKAATQELRARIRQNINELRQGLVHNQHDDNAYQQLIDMIEDKPAALQKLTDAQQAIDEAAIYTIHSFCQRILTAHAFESGILFEQTLIADENQLRLNVVQDFWRHYFTPLSKPLAFLVLQFWQDPNQLLADITPYLNAELNQPFNSDNDLVKTITLFYQEKHCLIDAIKTKWQHHCKDIEHIIVESAINKKSYSSRNLPNWLNKVTDWALSPTQTFELPPALTHFSQSVLISKTKEGGTPPTHPLFEDIAALLSTPLDLRSEILMSVIMLIRQGIYDEKLKRGEMGFDDLLLLLNRALQSQYGNKLASTIANQYCVAMIDEFQDTDPIQYQIFDRIYQDRENTGLLFIGDPKQAIYSFRGADIFTYLKAKKAIADNHFTMEVNWRSSPNMVNAVNQLFANHENPFLFDAISFISMKSAEKNAHKVLEIDQQKIPALNAYLLPNEVSTVAEYQEQMAICCAENIINWLSHSAVLIENAEQNRPVSATDIAILVRTGQEAQTIQQKLSERGVKSVYLSNNNSVFVSLEAKEVLSLLKAVLMPENETALRAALMTQLMGLSMQQIELLTEEQEHFENLIEEFKQYQAIWLNHGVLVMLRNMMKKRHLAENLLMNQHGERILTNFMHLGELLQEASYQLDSPNALIRWLSKQIISPNLNLSNHEQRLESDENLIKIITIHKSKGLEFPLVWIPFIAKYQAGHSYVYHDEQNDYAINYTWQLTDEIKQKIDKERLAEDLRLLYVAMTRSIYHCSIGLAPLKKEHSAINYLLNHDMNALETIANVIAVTLPISRSFYTDKQPVAPALSAKRFQRQLSTNWRVTSYTELQKKRHQLAVNADIETKWQADQDNDDTTDNLILQSEDIHHFPKGAYVGTMLHKIMETLSENTLHQHSKQLINTLNLAPTWITVIEQWLHQVLSTQLNPQGLKLSQILQQKCINELQFCLPIRQSITHQQFDKLSKRYDSLSQQCPPLQFNTVQGMLKGFIDLVFEWQGKFYLVDYKSNWLGYSSNDYQQDSLQAVMCEHRYDLQYQLYILALHRFLKSRLSDYQYDKHIGGVYYLFLRGMPDNGVFYHRPEQEFIEKLDQLFEGGMY